MVYFFSPRPLYPVKKYETLNRYNLEYLPITLKFSQIKCMVPSIFATSYIHWVFRGTAWLIIVTIK